MARDRRVKYTKMIIQESIIQLLGEKPINKITVKEICELADINRSTFYKYYTDPHDWLEQAEKECFKISKEVLDEIYISDIEVVLTKFVEAIKANYELFRVIFINREPYFKELFTLYFEKTESLMKNTGIQASDNNKKWDQYFYIYGCTGIIGCWIQDGMKQSPKVVASYIVSLFKKRRL